MFNEYPYTDYHELNTDWIIGKIKNVETAEANTKQYAEDADAAKVAAEDARDIAVQAKDDAVEAKDDAVEAKDDAISFLTDTKDQLNLLQSRVDNIIPDGTQTAGNLELLDIRVGYNGTTYASAGDAVRGQIEDLEQPLSHIGETIKPIYDVLYAYMNTDGSLTDRFTQRDYKIDIYDVSVNKFLVLNGTSPNQSTFPCIMFLKDNIINFNGPLNVSDTKVYMTNVQVNPLSTGNSVNFDNFIVPVPDDCNYVLVQNFNRNVFAKACYDAKTLKTYGNEIMPQKIVRGKYLNLSGTLTANSSYCTRIYDVQNLSEIYVKGGSQGSNLLANAFTSYDPDSESVSGVVYADNVTFEAIGNYYNIDRLLQVPNGAKYFVSVSVPNNNNDMLCYTPIELEKYVHTLQDELSRDLINCIGDSLTMGAAEIIGGVRIISPYSEMLQSELGTDYKVMNQGIGGENTLTIAARTNSICAILEEDITIPADTSQIVLSHTADHGLLSYWDGDTQIRPLLQGYELEGVYENGNTSTRNYYVWINGIRCTLQYWAGQSLYVLNRVISGGSSVTCYAGTPVIFERMKKSRDALCNIYWCGTNDADRTDLVAKLKAMCSYQNNSNYIIIGLHNWNSIIFTDALRSEYRETFGTRFFDLDYYTRTSALDDCGITPTAADTTAISNGLCPPSLMADGVHFITVFYQQLALKLLDKLKQINVIDY